MLLLVSLRVYLCFLIYSRTSRQIEPLGYRKQTERALVTKVCMNLGVNLSTEIAIILLLTVANGVFSGAEIAVLSVRKTRLKELVDQGNTSARAVQRLRNKPERFLATVQIGITVVGATAAAFGGATLSKPLAELLTSIGFGKHADDVALGVVIAIVSYLSLVIGELVPKSLALRSAEQFSLLIAKPLLGLSHLTRPLVWSLTASSNIVLRPFKDTTNFTEARLSPEELQQLVEEAGTSGTVDKRAGEIASRALDFAKIPVTTAMVPRDQMLTLDVDSTLPAAKKVLLDHAVSRIPVFQHTSENIVGYVRSHELLRLVESGEGQIKDILRSPYIVPESAFAIHVLNEMQQHRTHMALVVDEQGNISGLVTLEDLVEELIGDALTENDRPVELIRHEDSGIAWVLGRTPVHEVNRALDLMLPIRPGGTTMAGLAMVLAGSIPRIGTKLYAPCGTMIEVVESTPRKVHAVRVIKTASKKPAEDAADD